MINNDHQIKKRFKTIVFQKLTDKDIISISFVGSFTSEKKLSEINDIDLIIIVKELNKKIFDKIKKKIQKIKIKKYFRSKKNIFINDTFGPLKFNTKNNLVIHLMVYDIGGHKDHVIKSPFTVFDWERSTKYQYQKMSEISSVGTLQLIDFINSRRSINKYISDINKKSISYRSYKFLNNNYSLITKSHKIYNKDKIEFYFHIVKNLIMNYIKFKKQANKYLKTNKINNEIKKNFEKSFHFKHVNNIKELINNKDKSYSKNLTALDRWIKIFLKDFQKKVQKEFINSKKIIFIRHLKTNLNSKTFLGQNRNPSILKIKKKIKKQYFQLIYSSPLKRCLDTAKQRVFSKKIIIDNNLKEINYGKAEGLTYDDLKKQFPFIIKKWNEKKDPRFPSGENYKDILQRQKIFIKKLINTKFDQLGIITHNIFLRCLIGTYFNIPKEKWFKIKIPHGKNLEFLIINGKLYPNINRKVLKEIIKNI